MILRLLIILIAHQYIILGVPTATCQEDNENRLKIDVDSETDSNHDTALTFACAGGHEDLVELLLGYGAKIGN